MKVAVEKLTATLALAVLTWIPYATPAATDEIVSFATGGYASGLRTKETMHKMDANGDGMVSKDEWMSFHERMFDALDKDKSGSLDETEFTGPFNENLAFATAAYAHGLMTRNMFTRIDTNGDGKISREEFLAYHHKIFDMLDKKKKGMVGLVDFIRPGGT
jgi:Ca2+-binding EF-hand superfamily protein